MRPIDADAYAAEMKKRSDACMDIIKKVGKNPSGFTFAELQRLQSAFATFCEAKLVLDAMPTVMEWISVEDRLPDEDRRYLCWFGKNKALVGAWFAWYLSERKAFWDLEYDVPLQNITHWMPLPEPPKEVSGDG